MFNFFSRTSVQLPSRPLHLDSKIVAALSTCFAAEFGEYKLGSLSTQGLARATLDIASSSGFKVYGSPTQKDTARQEICDEFCERANGAVNHKISEFAETLLDAFENPANAAQWKLCDTIGRIDAQLQFELTSRSKLTFPGKRPVRVDGATVDLISGSNAADFFKYSDAKNLFVCTDRSPFMCAYLNETAQLLGTVHCKAICCDVHDLHFAPGSLAVLRINNLSAYASGAEKRLPAMVEWLAPGGQLILQTRPKSINLQKFLCGYGPAMQQLLRDGWHLKARPTRNMGGIEAADLHTVILTKPTESCTRPIPRAVKAYHRFEKKTKARIDL